MLNPFKIISKDNLIPVALLVGLGIWGYSSYRSSSAAHDVTPDELAGVLKANDSFKQELRQKPEWKDKSLDWVDYTACKALFRHEQKPYLGEQQIEERCKTYKPKT